MPKSSIVTLSLLIGVSLPVPAGAADYPDRPVRIVVPWAPGGTADILARTLATRLHPALGQPVLVDNRPGAAGNIGSDLVAKAKPDGYTLLVGLMNTHVVNPALYTNLPFNGIDDFTPIAMLAVVVTTMVVHPSLPVKDLKSFIALARARPGELAFASAGSGSSTHLNATVFEKMAGIRMMHIPYKGGAPAVLNTVTGEAQVLFTAATQTLPHVRAGKLRLLGITQAKRAAMFPEVPTIGEVLPGYEASVWFGAFGPAGLPASITTRLNTEINRLMGSAEVRKIMNEMGVEVINATPEQFLASLRKEAAHWLKVVRQYGIKAE